jgi:hypothetical protein
MATVEERFEAMERRVGAVEEREQMPLAYQREAQELAAALEHVQLVDAERLGALELRVQQLERGWWLRLADWWRR